MRHARPLLPILFALAAGACARQQPAYYVTDSATGQRVPTAQQDAPQHERGVFTSSGSFSLSAPRSSGYYADAQAQSQPGTDRGVIGGHSNAPVYAYQPPATQANSYRPPPRQAYAQQPETMSYRPPQAQAPQVYAPQPAPTMYRPPQPAGYYGERYRWY